DIKFVRIIGDQIVESRIAKQKVQPIVRQSETEEITTGQKRSRRTDKHIAFELWANSPPLHESERRRRYRIFPTELGIVVVRAGQHVETRERGCRRVGDQRRRPAELL